MSMSCILVLGTVCCRFFFFSSRRRHTRCSRDWSSDVCSSDLVDMLALGHRKELLDVLAPYGINEQGGWRPVPPERRDWLMHTQQQEEAMAAQSADAMEPHRASLPRGAHVRVILPESGQARSKQS